MPQPIHLPKVGMTMEEGTLSKWRVPDGAQVKRGDVIFDLETEKVEMEIEAEGDGAIKQTVAEGTTLKPGDVVGYLLAPGESAPAGSIPETPVDVAKGDAGNAPPTALSEDVRPEPVAGAPASDGRPARASPIARRLAQENNVDLASITGSGPDGRIVERDVQAAMEAQASAPPQPIRPATAATSTPSSGGIPYSGRRRTIGERMLQSVTSMAQLTLVSEVRVDEAEKMIHGLNREWRTDGVVVSLTALVIKACALALREHGVFNSRLANDQILPAQRINIGVAVDVDAGLMVPVLYDADKASLKKLAAELRDVSGRAREDKLTPDDVTGGTFTVTSLEGSVVDAFTPVINPPQAAILGVGRVRDIAVFEGPEVTRGQATTLSLTFDHRIADGAPAARFLARIAELLERPYLLM